MRNILVLLINILVPVALQAQSAPSLPVRIEKASRRDLEAAKGHFARARALLIRAVYEFDQGYAKVDPGSLIDVEIWREGALDKIQDLEKVLDPQPRVSSSGIRYQTDRALLGDTEALEAQIMAPRVLPADKLGGNEPLSGPAPSVPRVQQPAGMGLPPASGPVKGLQAPEAKLPGAPVAGVGTVPLKPRVVDVPDNTVPDVQSDEAKPAM